MCEQVWLVQELFAQTVVSDEVPTVEYQFAARMGPELGEVHRPAGERHEPVARERLKRTKEPSTDIEERGPKLGIGDCAPRGLAISERPRRRHSLASDRLFDESGHLLRSGDEMGEQVMRRPSVTPCRSVWLGLIESREKGGEFVHAQYNDPAAASAETIIQITKMVQSNLVSGANDTSESNNRNVRQISGK